MEKEVKVMSAEAARKGVKGVPFTVIDGRWAVSGCQEPECYYKVCRKVIRNKGRWHSFVVFLSLQIFEKLASAEVLSCLASKPDGLHKIGNNGSTCALAT